MACFKALVFVFTVFVFVFAFDKICNFGKLVFMMAIAEID